MSARINCRKEIGSAQSRNSFLTKGRAQSSLRRRGPQAVTIRWIRVACHTCGRFAAVIFNPRYPMSLFHLRSLWLVLCLVATVVLRAEDEPKEKSGEKKPAPAKE